MDSKARQLLFVTGMHRSGTSALCAALEAAGASFGGSLLGAMSGVNDEGFWEDADVVALNERLLEYRRSTWYRLEPEALDPAAWEGGLPEAIRRQALEILQRGFGPGPLEVVKDPRFCLTLPFWLALCEEQGIATAVVVASRSPLEVAASLEKRDGFPEGYSLRLYAQYLAALQGALPDRAAYVRYADLLEDASRATSQILDTLSLPASETPGSSSAVKRELRHQRIESGPDLLRVAPRGALALDEFLAAVEQAYPIDATLRNTISELVTRGRELSRMGGEHSEALTTIAGKDRDLGRLSSELNTALATIDERDEQIRDFDRRLSEVGAMHSHALEVIADKDRQLDEFRERIERLCNLPVIGLAFRMARQHAKR